MTMSWMETIRYIGLDLQAATVLALTSLYWARRALLSARARRAAREGIEGIQRQEPVG